ncbi:PLP-dependent transferase [Streptomyces antimycoticus]|uniref:PLP-dependent transferase n=1 Tax=Streptomyces antimycoticus TaxID=68175 RepID=UPI0033C77CFD
MAQVHHPGLPGDPGHMMAARQMNGFGAVLSFEFADADAAVADAACDAVRVIALDTGLGGVESTIERGAEHPGQEHVAPGLLRLSVGCEHIEDLWQDLLRASWSPVRDVWWPRPTRRVRGDERGAHFTERQPVVRAAFDELERRWAAELPQIRRRRCAGVVTMGTPRWRKPWPPLPTPVPARQRRPPPA